MRIIRQKCVRRPIKSSTTASAIVCKVSVRRNNPVIPAQSLKADIEPLLTALTVLSPTTVQCSPSYPLHGIRFRVNHQKWPILVRQLVPKQMHPDSVLLAPCTIHQQVQIHLLPHHRLVHIVPPLDHRRNVKLVPPVVVERVRLGLLRSLLVRSHKEDLLRLPLIPPLLLSSLAVVAVVVVVFGGWRGHRIGRRQVDGLPHGQLTHLVELLQRVRARKSDKSGKV